jgi:hypothetical protein
MPCPYDDRHLTAIETDRCVSDAHLKPVLRNYLNVARISISDD